MSPPKKKKKMNTTTAAASSNTAAAGSNTAAAGVGSGITQALQLFGMNKPNTVPSSSQPVLIGSQSNSSGNLNPSKYQQEVQENIKKAAQAAQSVLAQQSKGASGASDPGIQINIDENGLVTYGPSNGSKDTPAASSGGSGSKAGTALEIAAPIITAGDDGSLAEVKALSSSFSTAGATNRGATVSAALSVLTVTDGASADADVLLGRDAVSVFKGYSSATAQEADIEEAVRNLQSLDSNLATTADRVEKTKQELRSMQWKDVRLGFSNSKDAVQSQSGGFLNPVELFTKLQRLRSEFQSGDKTEAERAEHRLRSVALASDILYVMNRYRNSSSPSSSSSASSLTQKEALKNLASVHVQFQDVLGYLLNPSAGLYSDSDASGKGGIQWSRLFASQGPNETYEALQERQHMQARALQFVHLLRLKRFSARSIRVFDREKDGSEHGILRQKGSETQLMASNDLAIDTGGVVTVRTGPLKYNLTETLFNLQQDVRLLHAQLADLRTQTTSNLKRAFEFSAVNSQVLNKLAIAHFQNDEKKVTSFFSEIETSLQVASRYNDAINRMRAVNGAKRYLPLQSDLPNTTEAEQIRYLQTYLGSGAESLQGDFAERAVQAAQREVEYLNRVFGNESQNPPELLAQLLNPQNLRQPLQQGHLGFVYAAKIATVLLRRSGKQDHLSWLDRATHFLQSQLGKNMTKEEVVETLRTFFGKDDQQGLSVRVLTESDIQMWLNEVQVVFKESELTYSLAKLRFADYEPVPVKKMSTSSTSGPIDFNLRVFTESDKGSRPPQEEDADRWNNSESYVDVHPKSSFARLVACAILETVRLLDSVSTKAGIASFETPGMEFKNGTRAVFRNSQLQKPEQQQCFDVFLLDLLTAKTDSPAVQGGPLLENNNKSGFIVGADLASAFGFCDAEGPDNRESVMVFNATKNNNLLVDTSGNPREVATISTAIHEFMHAVQNANVPKEVSSPLLFNEGLAVMFEIFAFEEVHSEMIRWHQNLSGLKILNFSAENKENDPGYIFPRGKAGSGSPLADFYDGALNVLFNSNLLYLDNHTMINQNSDLNNISSLPYKHFLLFAMVAGVVTKDQKIDKNKHKEIAWILQFYRNIHTEFKDNFSNLRLTTVLINLCYGSNFTQDGTPEPGWFKVGKADNETGSPTWSEAQSSQWTNEKRLDYLHHCAKCYFVQLCFRLNTGDLENLETRSQVLYKLFRTMTEIPDTASYNLKKDLFDDQNSYLANSGPSDASQSFTTKFNVPDLNHAQPLANPVTRYVTTKFSAPMTTST